jgi:hypothetical protein
VGDDNAMEEMAGDVEVVMPSSAGGPGSIARATSPMGMAMPPGGSESYWFSRALDGSLMFVFEPSQ